MQIEQEQNESNGHYFINKDGEQVADMVYSWKTPKIMVIEHTEVDDSLKGQGVGLQLVERAVADAREKGFTIVPVCPFANAIFKRHAEFGDVRA